MILLNRSIKVNYWTKTKSKNEKKFGKLLHPSEMNSNKPKYQIN